MVRFFAVRSRAKSPLRNRIASTVYGITPRIKIGNVRTIRNLEKRNQKIRCLNLREQSFGLGFRQWKPIRRRYTLFQLWILFS